MRNLSAFQEQEIHEYIRAGQLIHAIKAYREATGVGLAEAKAAVEAMWRGENPAAPLVSRRDYDNPVLDDKIRSLLARGQKIRAVQIYREEYGIGLKEAKDRVDRIEASMRREASPAGMPGEPAIGGDPFAGGSALNRRGVVILAAAMAAALCGLALFLLLLEL